MMDLVLVRHGKAQDPATASSDAVRELTSQGWQEAERTAEGIRRLLAGRGLPVIWSSPLPRARQTAEVLARVLQVETMQEHEAIPQGQLDVLARAWQDLPAASTLFLVGHEPHLSQWGARMSGVLLPMHTAAAVGLSLEDGWPPKGQLCWFMQGGCP